MLTIGPHVVDWVAKKTNEHGNFGAAVGIGWLKGGAISAGVVFNEYNGPSICMHVASDGSKRWLCREFLRVSFDYPFNQARVNRITSPVGEGNAPARKFIEHIGFTLETRLRGAHPTGDLLVYVMWRDDCKWLRLNHA